MSLEQLENILMDYCETQLQGDEYAEQRAEIDQLYQGIKNMYEAAQEIVNDFENYGPTLQQGPHDPPGDNWECYGPESPIYWLNDSIERIDRPELFTDPDNHEQESIFNNVREAFNQEDK